VGKTQIFQRFTNDSFSEAHDPTVGADHGMRMIDLRNQRVKVQIYDTSGVDRHRGIPRTYYRGAKVCFVVFDVTNPESLQNCEKWARECKEFAPEAAVALIATKSDLALAVSEAEIQEFARRLRIQHVFFTSAKTGDGIVDGISKVLGHVL